MDILDDMGVSKLSAKAFLKMNYSFNKNNNNNNNRKTFLFFFFFFESYSI